MRTVKLAQRSSLGLYSTEFFFPSAARNGGNLTDEDRHDRTSLRRAGRYVCLGAYQCKVGDCLCVIQDSDVLRFRMASEKRRLDPSGKILPWKQLMVNDLQRCWNRTKETWEPITVPLDPVTTVSLCVTSYGLLCGCASSTLREALITIKQTDVQGGQLALPVPVGSSVLAADARERRSEDWCMLRAYVAELVNKHEAVPAPGAHQPGRITHISKRTWKDKWAAAQIYFKDAPRIPGSKSMLRNVWKLEERLKEKKACAHSKCNTCSRIDSIDDELRTWPHCRPN